MLLIPRDARYTDDTRWGVKQEGVVVAIETNTYTICIERAEGKNSQ
jgi:hypothetical protein